jgi:hypothetical protein
MMHFLEHTRIYYIRAGIPCEELRQAQCKEEVPEDAPKKNE